MSGLCNIPFIETSKSLVEVTVELIANPEADPSPVNMSVVFIPPIFSVYSKALPAELTLTYLLAVKLPGVSLNPTKVELPPPPPPPSNTAPL